MDTFFIVFLIIIIIEFFVFILLLSSIEIVIKDCDFSHIDKTVDKFKIVKMKVHISVKILRKILLFRITFDEKYFDILKIKIKHNYTDKLEYDMFTFIRKTKDLAIKYDKYASDVLKPNIKMLDIYSAIGMSDDMLTIFLIPLFSTYLSLKIRGIINKYNVGKYKYEIIPRYIKRMYFKIILNLNVEIKIFDLLRFITCVKKNKKII